MVRWSTETARTGRAGSSLGRQRLDGVCEGTAEAVCQPSDSIDCPGVKPWVYDGDRYQDHHDGVKLRFLHGRHPFRRYKALGLSPDGTTMTAYLYKKMALKSKLTDCIYS